MGLKRLNVGTPVATLPGAWRYRVSAGTGWPGVNMLGLGETESSICNFLSQWLRRPPRERKIRVRIPLRRDFSGSSHNSDSKIGTPAATLPGAWRYRVSAGTGWPGVNMLGLGETESLISSCCLSCECTYCCLGRSVPEIHKHVAGTLSNQPTTATTCSHHLVIIVVNIIIIIMKMTMMTTTTTTIEIIIIITMIMMMIIIIIITIIIIMMMMIMIMMMMMTNDSNNESTERLNSGFFTTSSLHHELSPTRVLK